MVYNWFVLVFDIFEDDDGVVVNGDVWVVFVGVIVFYEDGIEG